MRKLFPENIFVPPKWGSGKRLVIAEAPGETETQTGEPLTGGAGTWFDICVKKAGLRRDELTITNCLSCRPPGNVFPTSNDARSYISLADGEAAVSQCLTNHLEPVLQDRRWERVDILGATPLEYVVGKSDGIFKWRGSPLPIRQLGEKPICVPTLHPAYLARDQVMLPVVVNDLRKGLQPPPEYYNLTPTLEQVKAFRSKEFALDIETRYWWGEATKISMVGFCDRPYHAIVVPFQGEYIPEIRRIVCEAETIITQNGLQFDLPILFKALEIEWHPE